MPTFLNLMSEEQTNDSLAQGTKAFEPHLLLMFNYSLLATMGASRVVYGNSVALKA